MRGELLHHFCFFVPFSFYVRQPCETDRRTPDRRTSQDA